METNTAVHRIAKLEGSWESTQAGVNRLGCPFKVPTAGCSSRKMWRENVLSVAWRKVDEANLWRPLRVLGTKGATVE